MRYFELVSPLVGSFGVELQLFSEEFAGFFPGAGSLFPDFHWAGVDLISRHAGVAQLIVGGVLATDQHTRLRANAEEVLLAVVVGPVIIEFY